MRHHSLLDDPTVVVVSQMPVPDAVSWEDFRRAAWHMLSALEVELEGENAVLKPNVTVGELYADPDTGIITHPSFVQGVAEYLLQHGVRRGGVYVLEDPRNANDNAPRHWRGTGYPEVSATTGAKLRSPTAFTCVKKPVPHPQVRSEVNVSRLATAPNTVLFNIPKLKTHNLGITTLCMKNLMGVVNVFERHYCSQAWQELPEEARTNDQPKETWMDRSMHELWQAGLARRLIDLAQVARPQLNLVEGVVARGGTGFNRGSNHALGLCIAGVNMVAVDSVASTLMGFDPRKLIYLRMAAEAGLGSNDLSQLRIYSVETGTLIPCLDVEALCARPALRVISGIMGEDDTIYHTGKG